MENKICERFYTVKDIIVILKISKSKAYKFIEEAQKNNTYPFTVVNLDGTYRINANEFESWINGGMMKNV